MIAQLWADDVSMNIFLGFCNSGVRWSLFCRHVGLLSLCQLIHRHLCERMGNRAILDKHLLMTSNTQELQWQRQERERIVYQARQQLISEKVV